MTALSRDRELDIHLSAIMARGRFTRDPGPVLAELRAAAGRRNDILASTVGEWIGFYGGPDTQLLVDALFTEFGDLDLAPGVAFGRKRRNTPTHGTCDFHRRQ
jgi:hypothetical protein